LGGIAGVQLLSQKWEKGLFFYSSKAAPCTPTNPGPGKAHHLPPKI